MNYFYLIFSLYLFSPYLLAEEGKNNHHLGKIIVTGDEEGSSLFESVQSVTTLTGDQLLKVRGVSLGDTLKNEVGVSSTSYGPNSGRPVIRGLDGDRIRILQNGLGVLDASGASQDHAVPIDPLMMDTIEIVRGPLSLLYGSSAIGGVVNILTNRTHSQYEEGFHGAVDSQLSSVDNGKTVGFKTDYGTSRWMFHADGNFRDTQDLKINGFANNSGVGARDKLLNSSNQTRSGGVGTTYVGAHHLLGISASTFSSDYGVVADPAVQIAMQQQRFDLNAEFKNISGLRSILVKSAQSVYKHQEVESGAVGTTFKNNGNETRIEFIQNKSEKLSGLFGLQSNIFNFSALGDESFLPETKNLAQALFLFEELQLASSKINFGLRGEFNSVDPIANSNFSAVEKKSFFLGSASVGYLYKFNPEWSVSSMLSYSERAPNYQELFANGAHVATFSYQVGDQNLDKEKVQSIDLSIQYKKEYVKSSLTFFMQKFSDYISLNPTGLFDDTDQSGTAGDSPADLAIFNYQSQSADIYGAEFDLRMEQVFHLFSGTIDPYLRGDYLRGKNTTTGGYLPRITPPRASLGVTHTMQALSTDFELQHVFEQSQIATNETKTDAYTQVNLGLIYKLDMDTKKVSLFLRANNIFDVEARNHVSILKDVSQMGGRNYMAGIRAYF